MTLQQGHTLIVMPAFNEAQNIAAIIGETKLAMPRCEILVVDDGSKDQTAAVARRAGAMVLGLPFNLGVGGAMRAGFKFAIQFGFENVVQIDADGQHDPKYLFDLLEGLRNFDIVIGARFAGKGDYAVVGPRKWAMVSLSKIMTIICGTRLTDTTSGYKAVGPRALELFANSFPAEYLGDTVEALVIASRHKLRITQIPVEMRTRAGGQPSQSSWKSFIYLGRAMLAVVVGLSRKVNQK